MLYRDYEGSAWCVGRIMEPIVIEMREKIGEHFFRLPSEKDHMQYNDLSHPFRTVISEG